MPVLIAQGKCRLLHRKYSNFYPWNDRVKPRFIEHWIQTKILQQELALIIGQYEEIERTDTKLREVWIPIKSSDTLVIMYRKWLDEFSANSPMFRGFSSHRNTTRCTELPKPATNVYDLHTRHCSSCKKVYKRAGNLQFSLLAIIAMLLPALLVLSNASSPATILVLYLVCLAALTGTYFFRRKFL